ncbi:hypothetical protein ABZ671_01105 [Micromonospora sp. NPDC006766]|uniref:hypothetical protein n=1 Tax=Micromonospora sp. NPDC006766 TaxID=3154778 RepID=UPI0033EB49AE
MTTTTTFQTGQTVTITRGFAANMTGTIDVIDNGPTLGTRYLITLPCYGARWFTKAFIATTGA